MTAKDRLTVAYRDYCVQPNSSDRDCDSYIEDAIQQAMDSARDGALEQAAGIADEYIKLTVPLTIAVRIRALKTAKPAPASGPVKHGVDCPKVPHDASGVSGSFRCR